MYGSYLMHVVYCIGLHHESVFISLLFLSTKAGQNLEKFETASAVKGYLKG